MANASIKDWLHSIDLQRYEINFLHGGYDTVDQCLNINETDLITLDITLSGHIKVILANLDFIKKIKSSPSNSVNNSQTESKIDSPYSNIIYDSPALGKGIKSGEFDDEEHPAYGNVDFGHPTSPIKKSSTTTSKCRSSSFQKKKPIPAPRMKSSSSVSPPQTAAEGNASSSGDDGECGVKKVAGEIPTSSSAHFSQRSASLGGRPIDAVELEGDTDTLDAIRQKIEVQDEPANQRPATYVNIVRPFNASEMSCSGDEVLIEYENFDFKKANVASSPDCFNKSNEFPTALEADDLVNRLESLYINSARNVNSINSVCGATSDSRGTILPVPRKRSLNSNQDFVHDQVDILLSDFDLSYLENLSNEKMETGRGTSRGGDDSLISWNSLPPPSYPPPPLIISGVTVDKSPEERPSPIPLLPPRPGPRNKDEENDALGVQGEATAVVPVKSSDESFIPYKDQITISESTYCLERSPKKNTLPEKALPMPRAAPLPPNKLPLVESLAKFEGYLTRHDSTLKLGETRWFVLDKESLTCFNTDKQKNVVDVFPVRRLGSISSWSKNRCELSFEIFLNSPEKSIILTADSLELKQAWLTNIARVVACVHEKDLANINSFSKAGNAYAKISSYLNEWCLRWFHLSGKSLFMYNEDDKFHDIDLRKALSVRTLTTNDSSKMVPEENCPIFIEVPDLRLTFQGSSKLETTSWLNSLNSALSKFDSTKLSDHFLTPSEIPVIVDKCVTHVALFGSGVEGIYRLSGQNSKVTRLLELFNTDARGAIIRSEEFQIHDVSNCLKRFLRQLQEPLFTRKLFTSWIEAHTMKDAQKRLVAYKELLKMLPKINHSTIKFIISHLVEVTREVSSNKMDAVNIASIFGPILVSVDKGDTASSGYQLTNHEIGVVKDFLDNHDFLFDIDEKEANVERMIREAMKKMERLNRDVPVSDEETVQKQGMLVSVFVEDGSDRDVVTIQVFPTTTVGSLESKIVEMLPSRDYGEWRLFEVVCGGELERLMCPDETIISVLLKYKDWPQELCTNNSLLFKKTTLPHIFQHSLVIQMFLYSELKCATKKTFKKFYFEFTRCNLSYRKDPKTNIIESWKVEDLVIYMGVQKKRSPPTEFGLTFYPLKTQLLGAFLGYSICFPNEAEMYKWLAVLLNVQHSIGSFSTKRKASLSNSSSSGSCPNLPIKSGSRPAPPQPIVNVEDDMNQIVRPEDIGSLVYSSSLSTSSTSVQSSSASTFYVPRRTRQNQTGASTNPPQSTNATTECIPKISAVSKLLSRLTANQKKN